MLKINTPTREIVPKGRLILEWSVNKNSLRETDLYFITPRDKNLIRDLRHVMRENQTQFWRRFGVTQTQGSRFERGKPVPLSVLILIRLYLLNVIDDTDLEQVSPSGFNSEGPSRAV